MNSTHYTLLFVFCAVSLSGQEAPAAKCEGLPPGKHVQLERMTEAMKLTCPQQLKIEVLLHAEESVTRPLLRFTSFSVEQRTEVMTKIKIAARRQIKTELTPVQTKWMDDDIESVSKGGKKAGGKKAAAKSAPPSSDPLADQDSLCKAAMAYAALLPDEKQAIVLAVKKAALNDGNLQLSPVQRSRLETELQALSKGVR